jgi:hypothetical protein
VDNYINTEIIAYKKKHAVVKYLEVLKGLRLQHGKFIYWHNTKHVNELDEKIWTVHDNLKPLNENDKYDCSDLYPEYAAKIDLIIKQMEHMETQENEDLYTDK